jgi:hypothetical protein
VILDEPLPTGAVGVVRAIAFAAVVTGAVLLARQPSSTGKTSEPVAQPEGSPTP